MSTIDADGGGGCSGGGGGAAGTETDATTAVTIMDVKMLECQICLSLLCQPITISCGHR
jgi:hypothetical protein